MTKTNQKAFACVGFYKTSPETLAFDSLQLSLLRQSGCLPAVFHNQFDPILYHPCLQLSW